MINVSPLFMQYSEKRKRRDERVRERERRSRAEVREGERRDSHAPACPDNAAGDLFGRNNFFCREAREIVRVYAH